MDEGMKTARARNHRLWAWAAVGLWVALIFCFSSDAFAAHETSAFLLPLLKRCFPELDAARLATLHYALRKSAHVGEYAVLALLSRSALHQGNPSPPLRAVCLSLALVFAVALLDESRQSVSAVRTGSARDVALDVFGGTLMLAFAAAVRHWWECPRRCRRGKRSGATCRAPASEP